MKILVTGGAGFIGSHLVDRLVAGGHQVQVLDNLDRQVHPEGKKPDYLNSGAEYAWGDVRDREILTPLLAEAEGVVHLAAAVGVGQSQYEIHHYTDVNIGGTAMLLDLIAAAKERPKKLVVASSMSAYGEGSYRCPKCGPRRPDLRPEEAMARGDWEQHCACGARLEPLPTPESEPFHCHSVYALTKRVQEEMVLMVGGVYQVPAVALRFFNVYGPRQSLSNPYTGVAAIFMSRIKNGKPPIIFEDGNQTRDFVYVEDVAQAIELALLKSGGDGLALNVGTGKPTTIADIARTLARLFQVEIQPDITRQYRSGDIRHCVADVAAISEKLGYRPAFDFAGGMEKLIAWSRQAEAKDRFDEAHRELKARGLA